MRVLTVIVPTTLCATQAVRLFGNIFAAQGDRLIEPQRALWHQFLKSIGDAGSPTVRIVAMDYIPALYKCVTLLELLALVCVCVCVCV